MTFAGINIQLRLIKDLQYTCHHANEAPFRTSHRIYTGYRTLVDWYNNNNQVVEYQFRTFQNDTLCRQHQSTLMVYLKLVACSLAQQNLLDNAEYCCESVQLKPFKEADMIKTYSAYKTITTLLGAVFIPDVAKLIMTFVV